jgi:hypothetical protein
MHYGHHEEKKVSLYENKGNKEYSLEEYKKTMLLPTLFLPTFNKKDKSH